MFVRKLRVLLSLEDNNLILIEQLLLTTERNMVTEGS